MSRIIVTLLLILATMFGGLAQDARVFDGQKLLLERGFQPGPIDGFMGRNTRSAIKRFQEQSGLFQSGIFDEVTLNALQEPEDTTPVPSPLERSSEVEQKTSKPETASPKVIVKPLPPIEKPNKSTVIEQLQQKPAAPSIPVQVPLSKKVQLPKEPDRVAYWWWLLAAAMGIFFLRGRWAKQEESLNTASAHERKTPISRAAVSEDHGRQEIRNDWVISHDIVRTEVDSSKMIWNSAENEVTIGDYVIQGMIYTGKAKRYHNAPKCMVNPSLRVATSPLPFEERATDYWPSYSDIEPRARATYLLWLEQGRRNPEADVGYLFLFFYGLERRFFFDNPDIHERRSILSEVRSLLEVYGSNGSVRRYLSDFLELAALKVPEETKSTPVFERRGWEVPVIVRLAIGAYTKAGKRVSADWMLSWLVTHPEQRLRTPARRCFEELRVLFGMEFQAQYPNGYLVTIPKRKLKLEYKAASGEFSHEVVGQSSSLPDVSVLTKPINDMANLVENATQRLEKYSRFLGRNPDGRGSLEAQALLPLELRDFFPSEELEQLKAWVGTIVEHGGLIPASELIQRLKGQQPTKITKSQLTGAADALAGMGFGLAPDPRFALRAPKVDEPVVIFELGSLVERLEDVSNAYKTILIEIALSAFIAQADGVVVEREIAALHELVTKAKGVTGIERRRLMANKEWLLAVPPDFTLLKRKLKSADPSHLASLKTAIINMAHADGVIHPEEVARMGKIYAALGLDASSMYSDLHAGKNGDAPITVKVAEPGTLGEAIPQEGVDQSPHYLDPARIAEIRSDTEHVSSVLGDIFSPEEEMHLEDGGTPTASLPNGLDRNHVNLLMELISKGFWSNEEFHELAQKRGLFSSGAMETINEWAYSRYDEALLDEYDGIHVSLDIVEAIKIDFEEEVKG